MVSELVDLAVRYAGRPGLHPMPVQALQIIRADQRAPRVHSMHRPSLCFIVQGAKEVTLGTEVMRYASEQFIFCDYAAPLRTAELARTAGMSVSSFHQHFKKVTTLSPLQYQKQLRLHEARRLLLGETTSAADAGFRVRYESPSQFSREYARYFGLPPISDSRLASAARRG